MSAHVLLNLLNEFGKAVKCEACGAFYLFFPMSLINSLIQLHCGPWARHIYPSLVLVQPRKTRPCLTERLLMGRKESNQTNKTRTRMLDSIYHMTLRLL